MTVLWEEQKNQVEMSTTQVIEKIATDKGLNVNRKRLLTSLLLGAFVTACQVWLLWRPDRGLENSGEIRVVVASSIIPREVKLADAQVHSAVVPLNNITKHLLSTTEFEQFKERNILVEIPVGSPIPRVAIQNDFQHKSVPEKIPPGKRLFILNVEIGQLSGILKPGDRVDVVADLTLPNFGPSTKTLLENVVVVGVGKDIAGISKGAGGGGNAISFYVSPKEAEFLMFTKKYASFSVVLRNPRDGVVAADTGGMTLNKFLDAPKIKNVKEKDLFSIFYPGKQQ